MNGTVVGIVRFGTGLLFFVLLAWILTGQAPKPEARHGYPSDWSHRHLVFSHPTTSEQEARVRVDSRYWQYLARHSARGFGENGPPAFSFDQFTNRNKKNGSTAPFHRDWAENMGAGASMGADNYPAKYSFQTSAANCGNASVPDYVVYNTSLQGSASQASIVAYDNLYSGCTAPVPAVYWAYNTGGTVLTSPVISGIGDQVAFVQTDGASQASLVVLRFATGGTVASPAPLTVVPSASYSGCVAPCMTAVALMDNAGNPVDDRTSSAFVDYTHDVLWVGGASGWLHKITGVFRGTPTEATTGGFPMQLNGGTSALASPAYDFSSGNLFVTDLGGVLYQITSAGVVTASGIVDKGAGLVAGPVVDSTTSKVYVFSSNDGTTGCAGGPCSAVVQFSFGFGSGSTGTKAIVGNSSATPNPMYEGDFDTAYFNSPVGTGNLYVCGNTGGAPTLYQIRIAAGVMSTGTVLTGPTLAGARTGCSPLTDFSNPNVTSQPDEWIFAGVQNSGLGDSCSNRGCLMNFNVQPWQAATAYIVGQQVLDTHFQIQTVSAAGTSGLVTPAWSQTIGNTTTEITGVSWVDQGPQIAAHPAWIARNPYALHFAIIDSNGNVQVVTTAGTSKPGNHPKWSKTINGTTSDGSVTWENVGLPATASLAAAGGTSGTIVDNTVSSGGGSQVYFSTQSDQACGTTGTGGCAIQASQAALN